MNIDSYAMSESTAQNVNAVPLAMQLQANIDRCTRYTDLSNDGSPGSAPHPPPKVNDENSVQQHIHTVADQSGVQRAFCISKPPEYSLHYQ